MSAPYNRYSKAAILLEITNKDESMMSHAQTIANAHCSGGTYNMAAVWVKSKPKATGTNKLSHPATKENPSYPEMCGMHAELDLWRKNGHIAGGTVYVAGTIEQSGNEMPNTKPCVYCAAVLYLAGVRFVVYRKDGEIAKTRPSEIL